MQKMLTQGESRSFGIIAGRYRHVDLETTYDGNHPVLGNVQRVIVDLTTPNAWLLEMEYGGIDYDSRIGVPISVAIAGSEASVDVRTIEEFLSYGSGAMDYLPRYRFLSHGYSAIDDLPYSRLITVDSVMEWRTLGDHYLMMESVRLKRLPWRCEFSSRQIADAMTCVPQ